ncbi:MAG: TrbC/VirB2 family protein [Phycisphaerae bacterium]|jgi:type IV secretion system protein VirB2
MPESRVCYRRPLVAAAVVLATISLATPAHATTSGDLPWEEPLQRLADSFAGPVTQAVLILAIVALGFALAFSEGPILRRVLGVILGCAIAATATSFALSFFGFSSGATF